MIVTCPTCATRYLVDPAALRATGRTVRCARCAHTWHQEPPADFRPPPEPPRAEAPVTPPSMVGGGVDAESAEADSEPAAARIRPYRAQVPALATPKRRFGAVQAGWVALAVVVGLGAGGLVLFRDPLIAVWPPIARLYGALGQTVSAPLEIHAAPASSSLVDGKPVVVVSGEIKDVSAVPQAVPRLRLVLVDSTNHPVRTVEFAVDKPTLEAGETEPFKLSVVEPPAEAAKALVSFAPQ